jgi:hypothetical protein
MSGIKDVYVCEYERTRNGEVEFVRAHMRSRPNR